MMTYDDRKHILNSLLDTIEAISNKEYQKRVWIQGKGPECDSFDETSCYFYDFSEMILKNHKEYGLTDNQYNLMNGFYKKFDEFSDVWPPEFIDTPEWQQIVNMAKEILVAFN